MQMHDRLSQLLTCSVLKGGVSSLFVEVESTGLTVAPPHLQVPLFWSTAMLAFPGPHLWSLAT
jgi:hypothetical protein